MVRHRLGIREDASVEEAQTKLQAGLDHWIPDAAERDFLSTRLGVLLGIAESGPGREELFAGWRLFFERLAAHQSVVLAFEDMHWADDGLLDFVEYLLDWSAQHRILIMTFARPELSERRPGWPVGRRGTTAVYLEPLGAQEMDELLDSVAMLPPPAKGRIIEHAEGIPLFAIETVRSLADRGILVARDSAFVLAGELGELDVPPSLTALLGARLDALERDEREFVKSMSVFGGNFRLAAAQSVVGMPAPRADAVLSSLVRKQVLRVRADPLAPERGQYAFAQALLRTVAYERLTKHERKVRHVAAAEYLSSAFANEGEDVAEVVAAHYLSAYRSAASDADAEVLRAHAVGALRRGGQRAAALGAPQAAELAYRTAIDLAVDDDERIALMRAAGEMALIDGRYEAALELFEGAATSLEACGRKTDAARLAPKLGSALRRVGRGTEAIDVMRRGLAVLGEREDVDVAEINVELGPALLSSGAVQEAAEPIERALALAQSLEVPGVLAGALTFKALRCAMVGRPYESRILFEGAIDVCRRYELTDRLFFAQDNGADFLTRFDFPGAAEHAQAALATARRIGSRLYESWAASNLMRVWEYSGNWDGLAQLGAELLDEQGRDRPGAEDLHVELAMLSSLRGQAQEAQKHLAWAAAWRESDNAQLRFTYAACEATITLARGEFATALDLLRGTIGEIAGVDGPSSQATRIGFPSAVEAALALGRLAEVSDLLSPLAARPVGHIPPYIRAQLARGQGRLAAAKGDAGSAEAQLRTAADEFRALGYPYWLSCVQIDLAGVLIEDKRRSEAHQLLDEATRVFKQLGASPALERAEALPDELPTTAGV
jgi:tetratricopeptide (TPR) repeat protein